MTRQALAPPSRISGLSNQASSQATAAPAHAHAHASPATQEKGSLGAQGSPEKAGKTTLLKVSLLEVSSNAVETTPTRDRQRPRAWHRRFHLATSTFL